MTLVEFTNDFLTTSIAWPVKQKIDNLEFIQISALWKTLLREWKDKTQTGGKYLQNISDKRHPNYVKNS